MLPENDRLTPQELQANLRASIHHEGHGAIEDKIKSVMPGDVDFAEHPAYVPPNPYMKLGFARLKRALDRGAIPKREQAKVLAALRLLADGQAWEPQPCIATEQPERFYTGNLQGDDDIFDPSAFHGPSKFNATVLHSDD